MRKFEIRKLVRDKIIDNIQQNQSSKANYRILNDKEIIPRSIEKLIEEVEELKNADPKNRKDFLNEIGDIKTIFNSILNRAGISDKELEEEVKRKEEKAGGFKKGIFLEEVEIDEIDEKDEWIEYYKNRYKEIK